VHKRYFVYAIFACLLLSTQLLGQGAPFVLVTDLTGHQILSVNTTLSNPTVTPIFTLANSNLEGIVYGPDGTGPSGNKVYVCDPTADKIYRLSLTLTSGQPTFAGLDGIVYDGTLGGANLHNAQCGRFDSSGNFLVTSKTSGLGLWKFSGLVNAPLQTCTSTPVNQSGCPVQLFSGTGSEGDLTHANNGDILIVDITNKSVLRSVTPFTSAPTLIPMLGNFVQPTGGIARRNDGKIYVADGGGQNNIKAFSSTGAPDSPNSVCGTFSDVPQFIKVAADGTLYIATSKASGSGLSNGKLYRVDTSTCVTTLVADIGQSGNPPAIGVAIPPTSTSVTKGPFSGSQNFKFGFSQFGVSNAATCTATVQESQTHLKELQTLTGMTPVPFLGEAGFGTQFSFSPPSGCTPSSGSLFDFALAGFIFTNGANTNPRIVECHASGTCEVGLSGFFPISEAIPGDCCILKKPGTGSTFFVVSQPLSSLAAGQFCGFQNPLNNSLTNLPLPLSNIPTATGNTLAVKFTIAKASAKCSSTKTSEYITNAQELLSLIRVRDPQGNVTNDIATPVSSTSTYTNPCAAIQGSPICLENGNKTYTFSLTTNGLLPGIWNLSVTSLTNNINVQWNYFRIQ
jgi:hypothetical protein